MNTTVSLHKLVSELVQSLMPLTVKHHNLILNEVPRDLCVGADENMLAYVLWSLINGAIQSKHNECIHIEGVAMDDCMMIRIKDVGTYFRHYFLKEIQQGHPCTGKVG